MPLVEPARRRAPARGRRELGTAAAGGSAASPCTDAERTWLARGRRIALVVLSATLVVIGAIALVASVAAVYFSAAVGAHDDDDDDATGDRGATRDAHR